MAVTKRTFKCKTRGLSATKNHIKFGFAVDLSAAFEPNAAHELLVGAQVNVTLRDQNDVPGQTAIKGSKVEQEIEGSIQGIGLNSDFVSFSVACHKDAISLDDLNKYAYRTVKATFERTGDAAKGDDVDEDGNKGDLIDGIGDNDEDDAD